MMPAWVAIADLGSTAGNAAALAGLARRYGVSYLRISHTGVWNQALAFNTALRAMPPTTHAIQLDADMILHPALLHLMRDALMRCDALAAVPSYIAASSVPAFYDGTLHAFRALASTAVGGHPYSRGGFVAVSRDWLFEHRGYDEAYQDWGFEDADLWCRIGATASHYSEGTGSFLLHQSHPRQLAATDAANPNKARYAHRLRNPATIVNSAGWGAAPVVAADIRHGIAVGAARGEFRPSDAPVRRREAGRLRPASGAVPPRPSHGARRARRARVGVVLLVDEPDVGELALAQQGIDEQRMKPVATVITRSAGSHPAQALGGALQRLAPQCEAVLVLGGSQWLGPDGLAELEAASDGGAFLHGEPHAMPPIARDLDLTATLGWAGWASVACLDARIGRWWHFGAADWMIRQGLYDRRLDRDSWVREAVRRARRAGDAPVLAWPEGRVVSLAATRQQETMPPPGSAEAAMANEARVTP